MTKTRGPLDYLDDWGKPSAPAPEVDSAGTKGGDYEYGNPYRAPMPESPEWGLGPKGYTSFGHSADVDVNKKGATWGLDREDLQRGYSKPGSGGAKEPGVASYEQGIPSTNEYNRGADFSRRDFAGEEGPNVGDGRDGRSRENLG
jgi:hypothetical protein